jgi:hypothetical protein
MSSTIATVYAAGTATATLATMIFVYLQLRTQNRQLRQSALISLHDEILGPAIQQAIRFIYASTPEDLASPVVPSSWSK